MWYLYFLKYLFLIINFKKILIFILFIYYNYKLKAYNLKIQTHNLDYVI